MEELALFIRIYATVLTIILVVFIGWYILKGFAFMKAFKTCGHKHYWAGFVPFYRWYVLTECVGEKQVEVLPGLPVDMEVFKYWWVLMYIAGIIPCVGILVPIYRIICLGYCYKRVFEKVMGQRSTETAVLGYAACFIDIIAIIIFFAYSGRDESQDDNYNYNY